MQTDENPPLTLKDLQKELEVFAKERLVQAVRVAIFGYQGGNGGVRDISTLQGLSARSTPKGRSVRSTPKSQNVRFDKVASDDEDEFGFERPKAQRCRSRAFTHSYTVLPLPGDQTPDRKPKCTWDTSLKYEAQLAARAARSSIRGLASGPIANYFDRPGKTNAQITASYAAAPSFMGLLSEAPDKSLSERCRAALRANVESSLFEHCSAVMVVLNSICLGYDTNYIAKHPGVEQDPFTKMTEPFFCVMFTAELLLRLAAFGCAFFTMEGWEWNIFDSLLVAFQIFEQVLMHLNLSAKHHMNLNILRAGRLLRIVRFARLFRVFHLFDELRVIVHSMVESLSSLAWSMVLFAILIYVFSLVFLQCIVNAGHTDHYDEFHRYFSSVLRACLTMFQCVVGGIDWDYVVRPIMTDISPWLALIFCAYVSVCLFAMMNILTGIFADKATARVREDKDLVLAKRVRDAFFPTEYHEGDVIDPEITWDEFQKKLEVPAMQDYFKQINVDISEARALFDLMDEDGNECLNSQEIVRGCLRLRGPARSLDLSVLTRDVVDVFDRVCNIERGIMQLLLRDITKCSRHTQHVL